MLLNDILKSDQILKQNESVKKVARFARINQILKLLKVKREGSTFSYLVKYPILFFT